MNLTDGERNTIIQTVDEQRKGAYWSILQKKIISMIQEKEKYLNSFRMAKIDESKIQDYNDALIRLDEIKKFLDINEEIIKEHSTILERLRRESGFNQLMERLMPNGFTKWFKDFGNQEVSPK